MNEKFGEDKDFKNFDSLLVKFWKENGKNLVNYRIVTTINNDKFEIEKSY